MDIKAEAHLAWRFLVDLRAQYHHLIEAMVKAAKEGDPYAPAEIPLPTIRLEMYEESLTRVIPFQNYLSSLEIAGELRIEPGSSEAEKWKEGLSEVSWTLRFEFLAWLRLPEGHPVRRAVERRCANLYKIRRMLSGS